VGIKESKVQKVARGAIVKQRKVLCSCGGEMIWIKFYAGGKHGRMHQVCATALDQRNPLICQKTTPS